MENHMGAKSVLLRRRTLLGAGLAAVSAAALACRGIHISDEWRFLTEDEAHTVEAITAQLIPTDASPGAKEAGVVYYIDIQLSKRFKKHRQTYRDGLASVDAASRKAFGRRFVELTDEQQVEVLNTVEEQSKPFFQLILAHTRQGFYGDPRHGGNRNMVSWKMVDLPIPPVRGRQRYDGPTAG
jgi:gluconate 2-dehydrogenase gamma chain